jgi:hypothetical protein
VAAVWTEGEFAASEPMSALLKSLIICGFCRNQKILLNINGLHKLIGHFAMVLYTARGKILDWEK